MINCDVDCNDYFREASRVLAGLKRAHDNQVSTREFISIRLQKAQLDDEC